MALGLVASAILWRRNTRPSSKEEINPQVDEAMAPYIAAAREGAVARTAQLAAERAALDRDRVARLRRTWHLTGEERWVPPAAPAEPGFIGTGPQAPARAERAAAQWLRWLNVPDAVVTQAARDGGIDVYSSTWIGQVKWQASPVPPSKVRELVGVAQEMSRRAIFFASPAGYSAEAVRFANATQVALLIMDDTTGRLRSASDYGGWILIRGAIEDE